MIQNLIIGAGPAGLATGWGLSEKGEDVTILRVTGDKSAAALLPHQDTRYRQVVHCFSQRSHAHVEAFAQLPLRRKRVARAPLSRADRLQDLCSDLLVQRHTALKATLDKRSCCHFVHSFSRLILCQWAFRIL